MDQNAPEYTHGSSANQQKPYYVLTSLLKHPHPDDLAFVNITISSVQNRLVVPQNSLATDCGLLKISYTGNGKSIWETICALVIMASLTEK